MAAKKKKRKIIKSKTRAPAKKKTPTKRKVAKAARKAAPKKKTAPKKATAVKTKAKATARKTPKRVAKGEIGEGNYKASKRFRKSEEAFVKANKAKIPAMGKAAEAALDGPEGDELRAAEAQAASHAAGQHE